MHTGAARSVLAALADWVGAHKPTVCISVRHSGCTSGWVFYEVCGYHYRTPRMNLVICPWRTTVYVLGVLDALADLPA